MNTKYLYVRDENNFPVGCFAYTVEEHSDVHNRLSYAFSIYYMKDKFNKEIARTVAEGRLNGGKPMIMGYDSSKRSAEEVLVEVLQGWADHIPLTVYCGHPWAPRQENGDRRPCGHRFRGACRRTAQRLREAVQLHNERKANVA